MSLALYLAAHTLRRWREQPWSPLARAAVASLVTGFAIVAIAGLDVAEKVLADRLQKSGANTVVILSPLSPGEAPSATRRYESLSKHGDLVSFVRLFRGANGVGGERYSVYAYDDSALPLLTKASPSAAGAYLSAPGMPDGLVADVVMDDRAIPARAESSTLFAKIPADGASGVLLAPFAFVFDIVRDGGGMEVTLYERGPDAAPLSEIVASIEHMNTADRRRVTVISGSALMRQVAALREKKTVVTGVLSVGLIAVISLVFGALAALEYRENRFVLALLRSMGATRRSLVAQNFFEAFAVAFAAGGTTLAILPSIMRLLAQRLHLIDIAGTLPEALRAPEVVRPVAIALALGAMFATLPAVLGTRVPFGKILE